MGVGSGTGVARGAAGRAGPGVALATDEGLGLAVGVALTPVAGAAVSVGAVEATSAMLCVELRGVSARATEAARATERAGKAIIARR